MYAASPFHWQMRFLPWLLLVVGARSLGEFAVACMTQRVVVVRGDGPFFGDSLWHAAMVLQVR